jgi:hypothetical protein
MMRPATLTILIGLVAAHTAEAQAAPGRGERTDTRLTSSIRHRGDTHARRHSRSLDPSSCRLGWRWIWRDDPWRWDSARASWVTAEAGLGRCHLEPNAYNVIWVPRYRDTYTGRVFVGWDQTRIWWDRWRGLGYDDEGATWSAARTPAGRRETAHGRAAPAGPRTLAAPPGVTPRGAVPPSRGPRLAPTPPRPAAAPTPAGPAAAPTPPRPAAAPTPPRPAAAASTTTPTPPALKR